MAKNNEAKIKFTADAQEFNAQIKSANSTLASLRAGLKLNEAEFKNTGDKAEYLKTKHNLLQQEIEANKQKQEALNQKLELAKKHFGENSLEAQEFSTKLDRAKTEEQGLITQISQCENEMQQQAEAAKKEQTALEQLNSEISEQKSKLETLKTEYKNVVLEQGASSDEAQELKGKISQLNSELEQNEQKLSDVDNELKDVGEAADKAGQSAESSANGGWTTAKQIFADLATNAIQQCVEKLKEVAKEMVQLGIDFTSSMSNVQALSGATDDELASLEKTARELGSSTVFSASQVADGFSYMALAGWDTADMLDGIEGVLNLAAAADMDLAEASDIVTDYLTAFGLSAEDAGGFVDQMAFAMANSNTDVTQLGEAYKNCAATASSMGYSVEDTTAALMTMANAGVKGGEAGTGLSSIMTRLATDTKDCAKELAGYGVNVYDSKGNMNDLSSILNGCAGIWGTLTDQQQANLAKTIAGTSQYSKFQTVMNGLSESAAESGSSFNDYTKALENVKNASAEGESAAADMADTMQNNLGGDLKELNSAFEEFELKVYDSFENPLREAISCVTGSIIPAMTNAFGWLQEHKVMLGVIAGVILTVVTVMGILHGVIALGTALKAAEVTSISGLVAAHIAETASLGPLIAAKMSAAAAGMAALAPYILIVAAIAAVIAIIVLCVKHWDEIKAKVTEVSDNIKQKVTDMKENVSGKFEELKSNVTGTIDGVKTKFNTVVDFFKNNWKDILLLIVNPFAGAFNLLYKHNDNFRAKVDELKNNVVNTFSSMTDKVKGLFGGMKLSFPNIKMPHFKVSPSGWKIGDLMQGSIPKLSIDWYAKGAVFKKPTVLNSAYGFKGVGEAGPEAIAPIHVLQSYVQDSVDASLSAYAIIDYDLLGAKVALACAKMNVSIDVDSRELGRIVRSVV